MRTLITPFAGLFMSLLLATPALAAKDHKHGVAALEARLEGEVLSVELEAPLADLLGFERKPKYEKDFAKVRDVAAVLRGGDKLLVPTPGADCRLVSVKLVSAVIAPELLGEQAAASAAKDGPHGHADMHAAYSFKCARPAELKNVDVQVFDSFRRIRFINAQLTTGKIRHAAKLSARSRSLAW